MSFSDIVNSYKSRLSIDGLTIRDEYINSIKDGFTDSFDNNVNYKEVLYKKRNETNYTTGIKVHVFQVKKDTEKIALDDFKKVVFKDLDFICESGDLIKFDGYEWLLTSTNNIDYIKSCVVQQCSSSFTFVKNHISYTIPYVLSTAGQGMGLDSDVMKYISEISNFVFMRIPDNTDSRLLEINDIVQLGRRSYKIVADSDIINNGLLIFKMEIVVENAETHVYTISILNGENASIQNGTTIQLQIESKDNNEIISSPTLTYSSSNTAIASVSNSGLVTSVAIGSCVITVSGYGVSDTINIEIVSSVSNNYTYILTANIEPSSEIKYNISKIYTCKRFLNGVEQTGVSFNFSIIPDYGVTSDSYSMTVLGINQVSIKALKYTNWITLRCKDIDRNFDTDLRVKLRSVL